MWEDFSNTIGFWADMDNPYVTYDDNFIESEWWALKEIWNKGLLYKGFKIVPYTLELLHLLPFSVKISSYTEQKDMQRRKLLTEIP